MKNHDSFPEDKVSNAQVSKLLCNVIPEKSE